MTDISDIPMVFIHRGSSQVLRFAVQTALKFRNKVYLIVDSTAAQQIDDVSGVNVIPIKDCLNPGVNDFSKVYRHLSTNSADFEFFCIVRWIIARNLCRLLNLPAIFHFDHDSIPFFHVDELRELLTNREIMLCGGYSGHASYLTRAMLESFTNFLFAIYEPREQIDLLQNKLMVAEHTVRRSLGENGGVSDMTLLNLFHNRLSRMVVVDGLQPLPLANASKGVLDDNVNSLDYFRSMVIMGRTVMLVDFDSGVPSFTANSGVRYRALNIHLQGLAKPLVSWFREKSKGYVI